MQERKCLYAGTFDPWTRGHEDVLQTARGLFDHVVVLLAQNSAKGMSMFSVEERVDMLERYLSGYDGISFLSESRMLTCDVADRERCDWLVRGVRWPSEYEDELKLCFANVVVRPRIETIFIPPRKMNIDVSSTMVRELIAFGEMERVRDLVPRSIYDSIVELRSCGE